jgi:hypothetical protein
MFNICYCGAQDGQPHAGDCPRPLFRGDEPTIQKWIEDRDKNREAQMLAATGHASFEDFAASLCGFKP